MTFLSYAAIGVVVEYICASIQWSLMTPHEKTEYKSDLYSCMKEVDKNGCTGPIGVIMALLMMFYLLIWPLEYLRIWYNLILSRIKGSQ